MSSVVGQLPVRTALDDFEILDWCERAASTGAAFVKRVHRHALSLSQRLSWNNSRSSFVEASAPIPS